MVPRPTRDQLQAAYGRAIPDRLPDPLRLLMVGINPSLWTAVVGAPFARPGNRYYPALAAAGITDHLIDAAEGLSAEDSAHLDRIGLGNTNLVPVATARADEITDDQLREGAARLVRTVLEHRPGAVAVAGITAYRTAFGERRARMGRQEDWPSRALEVASTAEVRVLEDTPLFVVPNPSGLNAHESVASLARAYREAADAAGMANLGS